jgi:hypothetical protein
MENRGRAVVLVIVLVAVALAAGPPPAGAEPGHRGPVIGIALMTSEAQGRGGLGGEVLLGWAHRRIAAGLWSRAFMEFENLDTHLMTGVAVRWWSAAVERLYGEARLGHDLREIGEYEEPEDGPSDSNRDGAFVGLGLGFEVVRHPIVVPLDLRVGVDYVILADDKVFFWAALGLTFY